jgi:hypothetical protein
MKTLFFTILIDTYNYGEYIEQAVASALAQEFPAEEREILVVDDGSTDDTEERLRKFGEAIRYLKKPNGGQASAFNFGFEHARGEVIALLDADDVWLPGKLGPGYEEFERHPEVGMVYHRVHLWNGTSDISEVTYFIAVSGRIPEKQIRVTAISDGRHVALGVSAGNAAAIVAGPAIAAISGRCLSGGVNHFCRGGCGGTRVPREIPAAWSKFTSGECGTKLAQSDQLPDGNAWGAGCKDCTLAALPRSQAGLPGHSGVSETVGIGAGS